MERGDGNVSWDEEWGEDGDVVGRGPTPRPAPTSRAAPWTRRRRGTRSADGEFRWQVSVDLFLFAYKDGELFGQMWRLLSTRSKNSIH